MGDLDRWIAVIFFSIMFMIDQFQCQDRERPDILCRIFGYSNIRIFESEYPVLRDLHIEIHMIEQICFEATAIQRSRSPVSDFVFVFRVSSNLDETRNPLGHRKNTM